MVAVKMNDIPVQTGSKISETIPSSTARLAHPFAIGTTNYITPFTRKTSSAPLDIPSQVDPANNRETVMVDNRATRKHPFRSIELESGDVVTIPTGRAADMEDPRHVAVTSNIPSTPGYFRLLSPAISARYLVRGGVDILFGFDAHNPNKPNWWISNAASKWIQEVGTRDAEAIISFVKNVTQNGQYTGEITTDFLKDQDEYGKVLNRLRSVGKANNAEKDLVSLCKQFINLETYKEVSERDVPQAINELNELKSLNVGDTNALQQAWESMVDKVTNLFEFKQQADQINKTGGNWEESISGIQGKMKDNLKGYCFDTALGLGSIAITATYGAKVLEDMHKTYAETVAYEKYTSPDKITIGDIFKSDNKIIKDTCAQFIEKNLWRGGTDLLFFARHILGRLPGCGSFQQVPFGDIALGAKAMLLLTETQRRSTSLFTDLTEMIDRKLNPHHGLGDPMRASDLLDLYQKYNLTHNPDALFKDATSHDMKDSADWRLSNAIFARMADLMNTTYKYKHGFKASGDALEQLTQEIIGEERYFTMPKYLYLLGHSLIDPAKPEQTLAYVEIANNYGIQAVKDVRVLLEEKKIPLADVLNTYVVDLQLTLNGHTEPEYVAVSEKARAVERAYIAEYLNAHPEMKERYAALQAEKLEKTLNTSNAVHPLPAASDAEAKRFSVSALPDLSFFPADKGSLPAHSNDAHPHTTVTAPSHEERVLATATQQRLP
jgi:hypothetical protein